VESSSGHRPGAPSSAAGRVTPLLTSLPVSLSCSSRRQGMRASPQRCSSSSASAPAPRPVPTGIPSQATCGSLQAPRPSSRQVDGKKVGLTFFKNYANVDDVFKNVLKMKMLVQNLSQKCCILLFQKKYRFNILESCWSTLAIIRPVSVAGSSIFNRLPHRHFL
jgi:hypothetical protein